MTRFQTAVLSVNLIAVILLLATYIAFGGQQ